MMLRIGSNRNTFPLLPQAKKTALMVLVDTVGCSMLFAAAARITSLTMMAYTNSIMSQLFRMLCYLINVWIIAEGT
jgi:hypothetical protein